MISPIKVQHLVSFYLKKRKKKKGLFKNIFLNFKKMIRLASWLHVCQYYPSHKQAVIHSSVNTVVADLETMPETLGVN